MSKYFDHGMTCVYLDQDACSRVCASTPENDRWKEIQETIELLHTKRRVIIPNSLEHVLETSRRGLRSLDHDKKLRTLSLGYSLLPDCDVTAGEICALARSRKLRRSDYFSKRLIRSLAEQEVSLEAPRLNQVYSKITEAIHAFPNQIKESSRRFNPPSLSEQLELVEWRLKENLKVLIQSLTIVESGMLPKRLHFKAADIEVQRWNDVLCQILAAKFSFMPKDATRAKQALMSKGIRGIPSLYFRMKINALLDVRSRKLDVHDAFDISRVASALPCADVMVVDGGMASTIREVGLDEEFHCEVFSCKAREEENLLGKLASLL